MGFRSNASRAGRPKLFEGQRVLLVEDTRLYTVAVRSLLETRFGLVVVPCSTFAALKRELDSGGQEFDLAILDLCLADAPNGETLDHILACSIPAIVFSGYASDARREEILANRTAELVYKNSPRSLESLAEAVERILSSNRPLAMLIDPLDDGTAEIIASAARSSSARVV